MFCEKMAVLSCELYLDTELRKFGESHSEQGKVEKHYFELGTIKNSYLLTSFKETVIW